MTPFQIDVTLNSEEETIALATMVAPRLAKGQCLLLSGEIGAGKSAFARALIRARLGRYEDVPSPTFTLVQTYEHTDGDIWHCDLYRLSSVDEAIELGLDEAFDDAICLIEWPDRLGEFAPQNAAHLAFSAHDTNHHVTISGSDEWAEIFQGVGDV